MEQLRSERLNIALLLFAIAGLVLGLGLYFSGAGDLVDIVWIIGVAPVLLALIIEIVRSLARGDVGLDIVAALSMTAALVFGETLAAAVVAVMYSGGTFLEGFAEGRAKREMHALLSRVPRTASRYHNGGLEEVPLDDIRPDDLLLIRQGDVVPVDGFVASDTALLDTSALTGESMPARLSRNAEAMSFASIELKIAELAARAQAGKLSMEELSGGTFTISNGGIYGSMLSTPIVNPPQSGILGLHAIEDRPVARDGQVVIRPMMYVALTYDHRIVDGREAVTFLKRVKHSLEEPARILLEV